MVHVVRGKVDVVQQHVIVPRHLDGLVILRIHEVGFSCRPQHGSDSNTPLTNYTLILPSRTSCDKLAGNPEGYPVSSGNIQKLQFFTHTAVHLTQSL